MKFNSPKAQIYIPDATQIDSAIKRTTMLSIAAHQDDTEIMAYRGIAQCIDNADEFFTSVIVTDGAGSPRTGEYRDYSDDDMKKLRAIEQNKAASIGNYAAQIQLGYSSKDTKAYNKLVVEDIKAVIIATKPNVIFTHNLADGHDTHVAVALRVIEALRQIDENTRPQKLYGMEVWRGLDWLCEDDKKVFDCSGNEDMASSLLGVFESQIIGGKRYDIATIGRCKANATFLANHDIDKYTSAAYGVDLAPLMNSEISCKEYIMEKIDNFKIDVANRIDKLK